MTRVLVVDDDEIIRMLLRLAMEKQGYEVLEAVDSEQALARAGAAEVILLDLLLPGVDGLSLIPLLRAAAPDAAIVVVSGLAGGGAVEADARAAGAAAYLTKSDLLAVGPALLRVLDG